LIRAGLKSQQPFTVDPRPTEFESLNPNPLEKLVFKLVFGRQSAYEKQLQALGLKNQNAFTCACYLPEVNNRPHLGDKLAWSESSAVVFANSVLGARTNRNSSGIDIFCDVLGKAPAFGLLTDEGRKAAWKIDVATRVVPNAQLLGSAIGMQVMEDVPYITGLDRFLGASLSPATEDYLKDMGAASASNGAVGLYHVENITPEAVIAGPSLLAEGFRTYRIDDAELQRVMSSYPILWKDPSAAPKLVFIGCPHLSREQVEAWIERLENAIRAHAASRLKVPAYLCTPPDVAAGFRKDPACIQRLKQENIHLISICPLMHMSNPLAGKAPVVTNSNKLRTYTGARFFLDDAVAEIALTGILPTGGAK
jgi:predicted aconitase